MSNEKLIEQAREAIDNMDDFARMANVVATGPLLVLNSAIDALAAADKRIAELEELLRAEPFRSEREKESERKLEVAMDALKVSAIMPRSHEAHRRAVQALAQIGGDDDHKE